MGWDGVGQNELHIVTWDKAGHWTFLFVSQKLNKGTNGDEIIMQFYFTIRIGKAKLMTLLNSLAFIQK